MNDQIGRWQKSSTAGERSFGVYLLKRGDDRKVGLTSRPYYRFVNHQKTLGWRLLDFVYPMPEWLARKLERLALEHLDNIGVARGAAKWQEHFEGYTETWDNRDFEVSQIQEIFRGKSSRADDVDSCDIYFDFEGSAFRLSLIGNVPHAKELTESEGLLMFHDRWQLRNVQR
jgi:hypothetical protein